MSDEHTGRAVVIGGGLAGLSAAARLAKHGLQVILLEKVSKLGGRAITIPMKGFDFNFGAHAIYNRDASYLSKLKKELDLSITFVDYDPAKARYDLGETMTPMPATLEGLFKTKVLPSGADKAVFAVEVVKTITKLERGETGLTIGEWLRKSNLPQAVRELMLSLASSNFFTFEPERIPSTVYFQYYQRMFKTRHPVSYVEGGWESLVTELSRVIEENGGEIRTKSKIENVIFDDKRLTSVVTKDGPVEADHFVFAVPPTELGKLFAETPLEDAVQPYLHYRANNVLVYDIGLKKRIATPYTYIYDRQARVFMTDISAYTDCTPEGGQLVQAIGYLVSEHVGQKEHEQKHKQAIEALFDKHLPGWRDELVVKRYTKKAAVQQIKVEDDQQLMPIKFHTSPNVFFSGDWVEGKGMLSELSFSSAYQATERILHDHGVR
jgi:15-cis-phytoene desaturase